MKNILSKTFSNFGFDSISDFSSSMLHVKLLAFTIPFAVLSSFIENYFGLQVVTLISFIVLIVLELVTGLSASRIKGIPIVSRKFSRFGFKLGVWFTVFFILQTMKLQYKDKELLSGIYSWLHSSIFIYVTLEYLLSVVENISVITGEKNNVIMNMLKGTIGKYLKNKESEAEEFFRANEELLCVITEDGNFKKINTAWTEILGYTEKEVISKNLKKFVHHEDLSKTLKEHEKLKEKGKISGFVNRFKTKDGNYIYLSWNAKGGKSGLYYYIAKVLIV